MTITELHPTDDNVVTEDPAFPSPPTPPVDRVAELKRELAAELSKRIQAVETDLAYADSELDRITNHRKQLTGTLRDLNAELQQLTGDRATKQREQRAAGKTFPCDQCDRVFDTPQGRGRHRATVHPPAAGKAAPQAAAARPSPHATGRTVYRCGELVGDGSCGSEFRNPADLSHHTLTAHRRQPTAGEKILVTPDR